MKKVLDLNFPSTRSRPIDAVCRQVELSGRCVSLLLSAYKLAVVTLSSFHSC